MKKSWDVVVDGVPYHIEWGSRVVKINDQELKIKDLPTERKMTYSKWSFPVGETQAYFYGSGGLGGAGNHLVINGKDCATGEDYSSPEKLPAWVYVFFILHAVNLMNGVIGALLAIAGVSLTVSIASNKKLNTVVKLLLCLGVVLISILVVFALAMMVAQI